MREGERARRGLGKGEKASASAITRASGNGVRSKEGGGEVLPSTQ